MKKQFYLKSLFSLLLLFVGLNAWGETYTYDFSGVKNSTETLWFSDATLKTAAGCYTSNNKGTTATKYYYKNGDEFTFYAGTAYYFSAQTTTTSSYFMLGKSGAYVVLPTYANEKITSIKVTGSTGHSTKVSANIYTTSGTAASTAQTWSTTGQDHTYAIGTDYQSSQLRFQVTNSYNIQFTKIEVTTEATKTLSSLAISGTPTKTTYEAGDAFDPAGLVVTGTYSDNSTAAITEGITWTLDPETLSAGATSCDVTATVGTVSSAKTTISGLTVNAASKTLIGIEVSGTPSTFWKGDTFSHDGMTVTATWDPEEETDVTADATFSTPDMSTAGEQTITVTYKGKTATYTINVQTIANTQETAYTVAQIKAIVDAGKDLSTAVYVKGTVSTAPTFLNNKGYINFYISDDGTTTNQFEFYQNYKGTNSEAWTAYTDVQNGDFVIGYGTATLYGTTYEYTAGNYLVKHQTAPEFSVADMVEKVNSVVVPTVTTNSTGAVTYTVADNDYVFIDSDNKVNFAEVGGPVTITANIAATDTYLAATTTFTATVTSDATLSSITVGGDLTKSTYTVGDDFSFEGLTATGNYSDNTTADLSSTVTWTVEPTTLTAATTSVTVKATSGAISGTKEYTVTVNKKESSITIDNMEIGKNATDVAISATTTPADATLTYEITEGSDYITLTDGKISAKAAGTATVKATYAGNDEYATAEKTFSVTVSDASIATYTFSEFTSAQDVTLTDLEGFTITLSKGTGSTNPAWSSSQARIYANGTLTVKATNANIKSIVYEYTVNANKNNVAPTIDGVAGTTTAGTWNADTKTWTGSDSEVTFSTSGSAGNVGFTKLTITYEQGTKTETTLAWSASEATVTMEANDNVYPTLTTTPENLEGVTYESSTTAVATIAEDGTVTLVAPGTTTITAKYAGNDTYTEATPASYTLTVNDAPFVPVVVAAGYETVDLTEQGYTSGDELTTYKGTSFKVEFSKGEGSSAPKYYTSDNTARCYAKNTITITGAEDIKGVYVNYTQGSAYATTALNGKTATITFSDKAFFTSITVSYKSIGRETSSGMYGTICASYPVQTIGATVYSATLNDKKTSIILEEVASPAAGTPYIYQATAASQTFYCVGDAVSTPVAALPLVGVFEDTEITSGYVLQTIDDVQQFYKVNSEKPITVPAYKAYIDGDAVSGAKSLSIGSDDETNGINALNALVNGDAKIFDLSGRQLKTLQKGINIVNGVKVLVK